MEPRPRATTVGTMIEMRHLAATPVGMTARATATLLEKFLERTRKKGQA